jgi:hypothetical protein
MEFLHSFCLPPHYSPWKKPMAIHGRHEAPQLNLHLSPILYKRAAELLSSPSHNQALFLPELPLSLPLAHAVDGVRLRRRRSSSTPSPSALLSVEPRRSSVRAAPRRSPIRRQEPLPAHAAAPPLAFVPRWRRARTPSNPLPRHALEPVRRCPFTQG